MIIGQCHICGEVTELTYEHVPPERAFNDHRAQFYDTMRILRGELPEELEKPSGKIQQRGAGGYTLCRPCNNNTGIWYAKSFIIAANAAYSHMSEDNATFTADIAPLRFYKQVLAMMCSACGPGLAEKHHDLRRYILNPENLDVNPEINLHLGLFSDKSRLARMNGTTGLIRSNVQMIFAEIAFPPFVMVMTLNSPCPETGFVNIDGMRKYGFHDRLHYEFKLKSFSVVAPFAADYRSTDQVPWCR